MVAYERYNNGEMSDHIPSDEELAKGFAGIPGFPGNPSGIGGIIKAWET